MSRKKSVSRRFRFVQQTPIDGYVEVVESLRFRGLQNAANNNAKFHLTEDNVTAIAGFCKLMQIEGIFEEKPLPEMYEDGRTWTIKEVVDGDMAFRPA
jgi:hypothetical protein